VQDYAQEFRKRALTLDIPLYTQETLLKYIGRLHSYLRHIILMFNPTNLDEVCVQTTHIESRERISSTTSQRNQFIQLKESTKERVK